jgi:hypothetical protein
MPQRLRAHPNQPSPASPYYRFGAQTFQFPFNWYGGAGGIVPAVRAGETRGLGSADLLESDLIGASGYPAFRNTVLHRGSFGHQHDQYGIEMDVGSAVQRYGSPSQRRQARSRLTQPWPSATGGVIGDVVNSVASGVRGVVSTVASVFKPKPRAVRSSPSAMGSPIIWEWIGAQSTRQAQDELNRRAKAAYKGADDHLNGLGATRQLSSAGLAAASGSHGVIRLGMGDWPLVVRSGPEPLTPGEQGGYFPTGDAAGCARTAPSVDGKFMECIDANGNVLSQTPISSSTIPIWDDLSDNGKLIAVAAVGAGIFFYMKKKKNPARRRRRRSRRR